LSYGRIYFKVNGRSDPLVAFPRLMTVMTTTTHPSPLSLPAGTHALCTCGLSKNGAFCDGSHLQLSASPPQAQRPWWKFWG
jgi:CDGSH-type Zn-finger protein